jgi:hypothetical protein
MFISARHDSNIGRSDRVGSIADKCVLSALESGALASIQSVLTRFGIFANTIDDLKV